MSFIKLLNINLAKSVVPTRVNILNSSSLLRKHFSNEKVKTDGEERICTILKDTFPNATRIQVEDISGGCGDMYQIHVESTDFNGKRTIQQHKLVTNALKEEVPKMHGLRIFTSIPSG